RADRGRRDVRIHPGPRVRALALRQLREQVERLDLTAVQRRRLEVEDADVVGRAVLDGDEVVEVDRPPALGEPVHLVAGGEVVALVADHPRCEPVDRARRLHLHARGIRMSGRLRHSWPAWSHTTDTSWSTAFASSFAAWRCARIAFAIPLIS